MSDPIDRLAPAGTTSDQERLFRGLWEVRDSGAVNMLDRSGVVSELSARGYGPEAEVMRTTREYMTIMVEFGDWIHKQ